MNAPRRYNVDIREALGPVGFSQSRGKFTATCRETGTELTSVNAEYDVCHAMTVAGVPDGSVQFWRGTTPTLSHRSLHRMGRHRIALGEQFPQCVKRKDVGPEIFSESVAGSAQNREVESGGSGVAVAKTEENSPYPLREAA